MENNQIKSIDNLFKKTIESKQVHECILYIENLNGDFTYENSYGGKDVNRPFLMASITKLFTTACILVLLEQNKLSLNDNISNYLDDYILTGLHIYNGKEYSYELTISDLLFQVSGLPNPYEEGKNSIRNFIISGDSYIGFEEYVEMVKNLKPHFAPGNTNKAYYADINFDLLGMIIENITDLPLEEVYKKLIIEPLELKNTYLPVSEDEFIPDVYYKDKIISRPKIVISSRASGGGVSSAHDLMIFIKAFFNGKLFNKALFQKLSKYHKLQISMGPIYYGGGYMQIPLESSATLFMGKGELIGHSGSTGSFAFYYPYKDIYITGNINQAANQALPIRFIMKLAMSLK